MNVAVRMDMIVAVCGSSLKFCVLVRVENIFLLSVNVYYGNVVCDYSSSQMAKTTACAVGRTACPRNAFPCVAATPLMTASMYDWLAVQLMLALLSSWHASAAHSQVRGEVDGLVFVPV